MNLKKSYYVDRAGQPRRAENHRQIAKTVPLDGWKEVWSAAKAHELGVPFGTPIEHEAPENKVDSVPPPAPPPTTTPATTTEAPPPPPVAVSEVVTHDAPDWANGATLDPRETAEEAEEDDDEPDAEDVPEKAATSPQSATQAPAEVVMPDEPKPAAPVERKTLDPAALARAKATVLSLAASGIGGGVARLAVAGTNTPATPLDDEEHKALMEALDVCCDHFLPNWEPGPALILSLTLVSIAAPRIQSRNDGPAATEPEKAAA